MLLVMKGALQIKCIIIQLQGFWISGIIYTLDDLPFLCICFYFTIYLVINSLFTSVYVVIDVVFGVLLLSCFAIVKYLK